MMKLLRLLKLVIVTALTVTTGKSLALNDPPMAQMNDIRHAKLIFHSKCYSLDQVPCSKSHEGKNFPHPTDCNKFLKCIGGKVDVKTCSTGKLFNHASEGCDRNMKIKYCMCPAKKAPGRPRKVPNLKPIIGILSQDLSKSMAKIFPQYKSYIAASYVKYIESTGARVVPIMINQDDTYYKTMVHSLNGMVFPGGSADFTSSGGYGRAGRKIYDLVVASGNKGNPIPLWATCLGFEMLMYLAANGPTKYEVLSKCKAGGISLPLDLKDWRSSTLFGSAPKNILQPLTTMNITSNFHKYCVLPKTFRKYNLNDDFRIVSTNLDTKGLEFISTVEHKKLPIWGLQWHPEKNQFESKYDVIPNFPEAIRLGHYFAKFFVGQARQNSNSFSSKTKERSHLINNYKSINLTPYEASHDYYSSFHRAYFFK